jgi:hypothetical protein
MTKERIEKAVEIINYAIKNQISVKEASVKCGCSDTYVKNTKAVVYEKYDNGTLEDELFTLFDEKYKEYTSNRGFNLKNLDDLTDFMEKQKPKDIPPTANGKEDIDFQQHGNKATLNFRTDETKLPQFVETPEFKGDESYPKNHIKTLEELLEYCNVDTEIWKVVRTRFNKWDVTAWRDGFARTVQNFQVRADLERQLQVVRDRLIGEVFLEMIEGYEPPILDVLQFETKPEENNLLEISIFDLHLGKLAWGGETFENYDVKIARQRFLNALQDILKTANRFEYSRILFPVGNDFFNSDTIFNTTTQGTQQDEDLRWQKTFNIGVQLLVDAINMLKQTGVPVDVLVIPGNHDFERSYYMGKFLEAWFNTDSVVTVINGASPRKYYHFGKVLLGFTHGSEEKQDSLPMIMANDIESKPFWSETLYHEFHVGHFHKKKDMKYSATFDKVRTLNEDLGVIVRYLSSLTGTEEWHHKKGFVGAVKAADGFIWNDEKGLVAQINSNLIM